MNKEDNFRYAYPVKNLEFTWYTAAGKVSKVIKTEKELEKLLPLALKYKLKARKSVLTKYEKL